MKKTITIVFMLLTAITFAQKGEKIVEKYIEAIGGKNKLESVKSVLQKGTMEQMGQQMEVEIYQNVNGDGYMKMNMMGMALNVYGIKDGKGYVMNQQMGYDEMDETQAQSTMEKNKNIFSDVISKYLKGEKVEYVGKEEVDGKKYEVVLIKSEGEEVKVYFDTETNLLAFSTVETPQGKVTNKIVEYLEADGIKFPKTIITELGGQEMNKISMKEIIVNPEASQIDQNAFNIPE